MAEGVGFEPTEPCGSPVFKTGAIDHSTTPPVHCCGRDMAVVALAFKQNSHLYYDKSKCTHSTASGEAEAALPIILQGKPINLGGISAEPPGLATQDK
jgi:hypothetical protein